jgi:SAM-dependent methyltransferase
VHKTALEHGRLFFESYLGDAEDLTIVDIGSLDVNGSLRSVAPEKCKYVGVDFEHGKGVDVLLTDPYRLPFEENSVDIAVSSSCYEHSEFFWLSFLDALRILKPAGLFYLNVPSNGSFHRYPVDCWRFYPDSGVALQNWARRNGIDALLLESFVGHRGMGGWNDFVAVFVKDTKHADRYSGRIQSLTKEYSNGRLAGSDDISNASVLQQDQNTLCWTIRRLVLGRILGISG